MDGILLAIKMKQCGHTQAEIAEKLGISRQSLYKKLNGITDFKRSEVDHLALILHLTCQEVCDIFFDGYVGKKSTQQ